MSGQAEWGETLFGCCDDADTCCCGIWCTPCLFGQNAEKIDGSSCCLYCCAYVCLAQIYLCWLPHYFKRRDLRQKYGLREDPCDDCAVTLCCSPCALCQEARVLKRRGQEHGPGHAGTGMGGYPGPGMVGYPGSGMVGYPGPGTGGYPGPGMVGYPGPGTGGYPGPGTGGYPGPGTGGYPGPGTGGYPGPGTGGYPGPGTGGYPGPGTGGYPGPGTGGYPGPGTGGYPGPGTGGYPQTAQPSRNY